jgi:hypothetical protein
VLSVLGDMPPIMLINVALLVVCFIVLLMVGSLCVRHWSLAIAGETYVGRLKGEQVSTGGAPYDIAHACVQSGVVQAGSWCCTVRICVSAGERMTDARRHINDGNVISCVEGSACGLQAGFRTFSMSSDVSQCGHGCCHPSNVRLVQAKL